MANRFATYLIIPSGILSYIQDIFEKSLIKKEIFNFIKEVCKTFNCSIHPLTVIERLYLEGVISEEEKEEYKKEIIKIEQAILKRKSKAKWEQKYSKEIGVIENETIRDLLFEFAVNASLKTAIKLLQKVVKAKPDGIIGKKTLQKLNQYLQNHTEEDFIKDFTLARIAFYTNLANKNPKKYGLYLRGWINRSLKALEEIA